MFRRGRAREIVSAPLREAESAAVIGNVKRLIRSDGEAVGSALHLLYQDYATVRHQAADLLRFDLHEKHRAVLHVHRSLWKFLALGENGDGQRRWRKVEPRPRPDCG